MVVWLWEVLESFTPSERVLFVRFVSGRSRLPANLADLSQRFQVSDNLFPTSISELEIFILRFEGLKRKLKGRFKI